jgi:hypothetical protein
MSTINNIGVIYVPWYLKANLDANGMDIDELKSNLKRCETKLAIADINDLQIVNRLIVRDLFKTINFNNNMLIESLSRGVGYSIDFTINQELELINLLTKEDSEFFNTFNLIYSNNTIYVILKEGFTNFIKFNNQKDRDYLIESLTNFMFKHFNSKDVYNDIYFKTFLSLKQ